MVLERNLCFVDTVGNDSSQPHRTDTVVQYMHQQLLRATSAVHAANAADFQNLLAGNGGSQVDAILYLISEGTSILIIPQLHMSGIANPYARYFGR